jgi:radical SAM-linked protein
MTRARVAVRFSRDASLAAASQTDILQAWAEALRASRLPIELTTGRSPRPRFALAAHLPIGYTSEAEWAEVSLSEDIEPSRVVEALSSALPRAMRPLEARRMSAGEPSLHSQLKFAEYRVVLGAPARAADLEKSIDAFFARRSFEWEESFDGRVKRFDLLSLVDDLWVEQSEGGLALGMRLDASTTGTGRPDSVLAGLGLTDIASRHRTRLIFSYLPEAVLLWRRIGRFLNERPER